MIRPCPQFAEGDRVVHDAHGLGRVTRVEGQSAVLVDFGSHQERIASPFEGMSHL
ncbi:CarD family transcriptional regulator [Frankia sp. EI5c]|uniref:CarD family transcriptional regulator n=1 Tax=Frankia sp. EI5c TaxID=683316 RepID=UPI000A6A9F4D|nr:CarD family transcriptional regulator [Frankia sp. EI5c]